MIAQLVGLILLGLGVKTTPFTAPTVKGVTTATTQTLLYDQKSFLERLSEGQEASKPTQERAQELFEQKLSGISDAKKQALLEKLNFLCGQIQTKRTDMMTNVLTKLSTALDYLVTRTAAAKTNGKDVTSVETALSS